MWSETKPLPTSTGHPQAEGISQVPRSSLRKEGIKPYVGQPQSQGSAPGRQAPITSGFENQQSLTLGALELVGLNSRRLQGTGTPLLKGQNTTSLAVRPSTDAAV